MFFNVKDVRQFQQQKDFIDTALVPLLSLDFEDAKIKQSSSAAEFLMSLTAYIEQQFRGRVLLVPPFSYTEQTKSSLPIKLLQKDIENAGFKHVFYITCDHSWTMGHEQLDIIWLPAIPLESMDARVKQSILQEQLKQIIPNLTSKWSQS